jgi:hypothetical protein
MRPHGSFSDFVRKSSCPCAAARPRRIEVAASSVQASPRDASESRSLTKATRLRRPLWVKPGNTRSEQMTSAVAPIADMSRPLRHVRSVPLSDSCTAARRKSGHGRSRLSRSPHETTGLHHCRNNLSLVTFRSLTLGLGLGQGP